MRRNYSFLVFFVLLVFGLYQLHSNSGVLLRSNGTPDLSEGKFRGWKKPSATTTDIETTIPGGNVIHGFSLLDRLYLRKGVFYVVTSDLSSFPSRKNMIARPLDIGAGHNLDPTDRELQFITRAEAKEVLGEHALVIDGFSLIVYDTEQYMDRFYHWWGEIIFGAWRVFSGLTHPPNENPVLSFASRVVLPHVFSNEWRDVAGLNAGLMRACFPSTNIEKLDYWDDLVILDSTVVFERAMIISREAASTHKLAGSWYTMISSTMSANASDTFWEPMRRHTIQNVLGYLPLINNQGHVISPSAAITTLPIVTYIVRQGVARRLSEDDHDSLVEALKELERSGICQVYVVQMEKLSIAQQIEIMARTTVVVGVHGNGLTHQLWMPPSSRSTVIEIFAPKSYVFEHEILARNLGHKHYAVWNDKLLTFAKGKYFEGIKYAEDFHGLSIPVHGSVVAEVIRERLAAQTPKGQA